MQKDEGHSTIQPHCLTAYCVSDTSDNNETETASSHGAESGRFITDKQAIIFQGANAMLRKYQLLRGNTARAFKLDLAISMGLGLSKTAPMAAMPALKNE